MGGQEGLASGGCGEIAPVQPEAAEGSSKRQRQDPPFLVSRRSRLQEHEQRFRVVAPLRAECSDVAKPADQTSVGECAAHAVFTVRVVSDPDGLEFPSVGGRLWAASVTLAQLLLRPDTLGPAWIERLLGNNSTPLRALELGAGTAAPSLCLAYLGHSVVATDLPDVTTLTQFNVEANAPTRVDVRPMKWGDEELAREAGEFDLVIGADLFYDPALFGPLLDTLRALPCFRWALFAVVLRPEDLGEETFENFCEDEGLKLELRHTELPRGCGTHRVNVYELDGATVHSSASLSESRKADDGAADAVACSSDSACIPFGAIGES